jgi:hypothetical protein
MFRALIPTRVHRGELNVLGSRWRHPCVLATASLSEFSAPSTATAIITAAGIWFDRWEYGWEEYVEDWTTAWEAGADDANVRFNDRPHGGSDVV